jgi:hypothetical protein
MIPIYYQHFLRRHAASFSQNLSHIQPGEGRLFQLRSMISAALMDMAEASTLPVLLAPGAGRFYLRAPAA